MQDNSSADSISTPAASSTCPYHGIGSSFDPFSKAYLSNPYAFFAQARQSEPVFFSPQLNTWLVTRYDDIKAVLHDPPRFSSVGTIETVADFTPAAQAILSAVKPVLPHGINNTDPPRHTRIRASVNKAFSAQRVIRYEPLVRQLANKLVDQFVGDSQVDIVQRFNYPFPALVLFHLMGVPQADLKQVQAWCCDWIELHFARLSPERQIECAQSAVAYQRYIEALIEQRRAIPQDDLASDLIAAVNSGEAQISQEELFALIFGLVLVGNDTIAALLGNCLCYVLRDRSHWQVICETPKFINGIVEETLRFDGSALGLFRVTTEVVELGGVTLPKGAYLMVLFSSASHDEKYFPDPEVFNPQRQNLGRHMGFGSGIHFCLGAPLARLATRVALEVLSTRLPNLRLVPGQELSYKHTVHLRALNQLHVAWDIG